MWIHVLEPSVILKLGLQICLAILAPVANWALGNYRLSMYVELCFVSAAVIFQINNLLSLSTVLVDQFLQLLKTKILLKKATACLDYVNQEIADAFVILYSS